MDAREQTSDRRRCRGPARAPPRQSGWDRPSRFLFAPSPGARCRRNRDSSQDVAVRCFLNLQLTWRERLQTPPRAGHVGSHAYRHRGSWHRQLRRHLLGPTHPLLHPPAHTKQSTTGSLSWQQRSEEARVTRSGVTDMWVSHAPHLPPDGRGVHAEIRSPRPYGLGCAARQCRAA